MSYTPTHALGYELHLLNGTAVALRLPIFTATVTIGRTADNTIVLTDPRVSRHHTRLTWDGAGFIAEDAGSSAGTYVNGVPIQAAVRLNPGDTLTLGGTLLRLSVVAAPQTTQPAAVPPPMPLPPVVPPRPNRRLVVPMIAALLLLLAGAGVALALLGPWRSTASGLIPPAVPGGQQPLPTPEPTPPPEPLTLTIADETSLAVVPDGTPQTNANGVSLTAPPDLLEAPGTLALVAGQAHGALAEELQRLYTLETPFYAVMAEQDGRGAATLSFPAASPESRVALLLDNEYLALLDTPPQNGVLQVRAFVGPRTLPDPPPLGVARDGSLRYVVLGPKQSGMAEPDLLTALIPAETAYAADSTQECLQYATLSRCRTDGTVYVMWRMATPLKTADADAIITTMQTLMQAYVGKGFTGATIGVTNTVSIIVDAHVGAPEYSTKNGVLYLPLDTASGITADATRRELAHELFHWIEDVAYTMTVAAFSNPKTWWLEVAAENGVFLIDDGAQAYNLEHYGQTTINGPTLGFQAAPYVWKSSEEARYIQAQLLTVNMCDSADCAISQQRFIAAINAGEYPLLESSAQATIHTNLDEYARYLLGSAPERTNTTISLAGVNKDAVYGDLIDVQRTTKTEFEIKPHQKSAQLSVQTPQDHTMEVLINAPIEQDGVYPLRVVSRTGNAQTWPVMLTIEPGVELYYRLGDDPPQHHAGDRELILGPIHKIVGYDMVRVVAIGREAGTLKGTVRLVDLQGDWLLLPGKVVSNSVQCSGEGATTDPNKLKNIATVLATTVAPKGSYTRSGLNELTFTLDPGATLNDDPDDRTEFTASGLIGPHNIQGMQRLYVPPPENTISSPLALLVLPLGLVAWRVRRRAVQAAAVMLAAIVLAGCIGMEISGSIDTRYVLEKLEYIGKGDTMGEPIWRISKGQAATDVDLTITVEVASLDDSAPPEPQTSVCRGRVEHELVVEIYKDGVVQPEPGE